MIGEVRMYLLNFLRPGSRPMKRNSGVGTRRQTLQRFSRIFMYLWGCLLVFGVMGSSAFAQKSNDPNCSPPNLLMVVDVSGSMHQAGKLEALKKAIKGVILEFQGKIRFGLISFQGAGAKLEVQIGPADPKKIAAHVKNIIDATQKLNALGGTPMTAAMKEAKANYLKFLPQDPIHKLADPKTMRASFVLLMTDGEPTDGDPLPVIQSLRKLKVGTKTYDIKTFVVGMGSGQDIRTAQLQKYAVAGGTQKFYHALTQQQLSDAFKSATKAVSKKETCNGRDDDCDGLIDEDIKKDCKSKCGTGIQVCHKGKWSPCNAPPEGKEICDGRDNDCDGQVDEGLGRPCSTDCGKGTQSCIRGDWSACSAKQPEAEICDGIDNDCDGTIDNGKACPNGKCIPAGAGKHVCDIPCAGGECPTGFKCDKGTSKCVERPCRRKKCKPGEICDETSGSAVCKNICKDVICGPGQTCGEKGTCVNCYESKCPPQMICFEGRCVVDTCLNVACDKGQACRDGKCFDVCKCPSGDACTKGNCHSDPCKGVNCKTDEVCLQGQCVKNSCTDPKAPQCGKGLICHPGTGGCQDDPCRRTHCPEGTTCRNGECYPGGGGNNNNNNNNNNKDSCKKDLDCGKDQMCKNGFCVKATPPKAVGGSCNCSTADAAHQDRLLVGVLLILMLFGFLSLFKRTSRYDN